MTRAPAELRLVADLAAKALAAAGAPATGDGVAVAVSGGADSLALLHALRALAGPRGWRLAVLTVDPSSTRTKGSILGDKTRMARLSVMPVTDAEWTRIEGMAGR